MDSVSPIFTGNSPVGPMGPELPSAGLFGSGGEFKLANTLQTTSALNTGFGGFASYQYGNAQKSQFDMEAKSFESRAEVAKLNAIEKSNFLRKQLLRDLGSANANAGARGIDTGSGSPAQVRTQSIGEVERDVAKIKRGGEIEAGNELTSAARSRSEGSSAQIAAYIKTAGGLGKYALSQVL